MSAFEGKADHRRSGLDHLLCPVASQIVYNLNLFA